MKYTITDNLYPGWNSFGSRKMEKMLLLFADGQKAHGAAGDIRELKQSYEVVKNVFFEFGVRTNDHSHIPDFSHLESRLFNYGKALIHWCPTPENKQTIYDLLIRPGDKILRKHRELHEESAELIERAVKQVETLKGSLRTEDFQDILGRYEDMRQWVFLHQDEYEAYIWLLIHRKNPSGENSRMAGKALLRLKERTDKIKRGEIRDCYLFSVSHVEEFLRDCQREFLADTGQGPGEMAGKGKGINDNK